MKKLVLLILAVSVLMMASLTADDTDITGVWIGETYVPEYGMDQITLKITKEEGTYSGELTDTAGYAADTPCEDFKYEEGKVTFRFYIGQGEYVYFNLTVEGDKMTGYWDGGGGTGDVTLEKKE